MTDTDEATVLITGATDGLGRRVAHDLAASGTTVLLHGRDEERVETTVREIREGTNNDKLRCYRADFSSLGEVRRLAEEVRTNHAHLDVLINNAGVFARERAVSRDGHELTFAVNFLAPFLLTYLLVPLLRGSAPARVVNVASAGQSPVNFDDPMLERGYDGMRAYAQSKLALVMFTFDLLAGQLEGTGVTANYLHPATLMGTKISSRRSVAPRATCRRAPTRRSTWPPTRISGRSRGATSRGNVRHAPKGRPTTRRPGRGCGRCRRN